MIPKKPNTKEKMMQVNVLELEGKLTINIKRKGFTNAEAIGVMEMAKEQMFKMIRMNPHVNFKNDNKEKE